jgi:hypothetical protein
MQRVITLDPTESCNHFLYDVAENKQRQLAQLQLICADDLWAQINCIHNQAQLLLL